MKRIITVCLALTLLLSLGALLTFAETETDITVKYGKADLSLSLVDPYDEEQHLPGFMNWGNGNMSEGRIYMECGGGSLYDIYNMTTAALKEDLTVGGNTHIVFAAENTSDGDIFFGFQPDVMYNGAAVHAYLSSELAKENPIKLIHKDGTVEDAKFWMQRSAGREVVAIPYEFDGYIVIPHTALSTDIEKHIPVTADGKVEYTGFGLHALPDDASYMEFTITAAYACAALPAYEAPEKPVETLPETTAPETTAPETSAPETSAPETKPETLPETTAPETEKETIGETQPETTPDTRVETTVDPVTEPASEPVADTVADTPTDTEAPEKEGCASVMSTAALLMTAVAACVVLKRKD